MKDRLESVPHKSFGLQFNCHPLRSIDLTRQGFLSNFRKNLCRFDLIPPGVFASVRSRR
jgi:hypothetical protein